MIAPTKLRNNSGTFHVDNPKKMKKVSGTEDVTIKKKRKSSTTIDDNEIAPRPSKGNSVVATKKHVKNSNHQNGAKGKRKFQSNGNETDGQVMKKKMKKQISENGREAEVESPSSESLEKVPPTYEKPDWNKVKKDREALREKRRSAKRKDGDISETLLEAKKILDVMRRKKCPPSEQINQLVKLHSFLKGKLLNVAYAHDLSRVIETMLKFAHIHKQLDILQSVIKELLPEFIAMSKRKYATHVARSIVEHSTPAEKASIIKAIQGSVFKLVVHKFGRVVIQLLYSKCKPEEQCEIRRELYGDTQKLIGLKNVTGLSVIFDELPTMKSSTLLNTKQILLDLFEKDAVQSGLVHSVLLDYLSHASPEDISEVLEEARKHIQGLTLSKDGVHVAMMCVWMGTAKARKKLIKELKGGLMSLAIGEYTHLLLLAIFDSVDDTQFVQKAVLEELLSGDISPLLSSTYGRKVIAYLCHRRDPKMFSAPVIATLSAGDNNPHSKKDSLIRATELQQFAVPLILQHVAQNTTLWIENNANLPVLLSAVTAGSGEKLKAALSAVAKHITNPPNPKHMGIDLRIVDNTGCHMVLKKIAQHDKDLAEKGEATFGEALFSELTDQHYLAWLRNNHCCFLLLEVLKNTSVKISKKFQSKISGLASSAWKKESPIPIGGQRLKELL